VLARATRETTLTAAGALVLGTHFPALPGGRLAAEGRVWQFTSAPVSAPSVRGSPR
jgi:hypothetical protein